VLGVVIALGVLGMEGVEFADALLYGFAHSAVGLVFAGVTAVTSQLASYASNANGLAFGVLGLAIFLRAIGDVQDNVASWLSPIGWSQQTFAMTPVERWWPLAISAGAFLLLVWLAFALVAKRDFGSGMMQARPGRAHAKPGLDSSAALTLRLTRGLRWAGVITMVLLGAAYGSVLGTVNELFDSLSETQMQIISQGGGSLEDNFAATIAAIDALFATLFGLLVIGRGRKEETAGRGELLAATATPRRSWPGSYLPAALYAASLAAVVGGLFLAWAGAASVGDWSSFGKLFVASVQYLPAIWVLIAFAFAGIGWLPRAGWLRWLVWVFAFVVAYYGEILEMPGWLRSVSPFDHIASYPAVEIAWAPLILLTLVAAALAAIGYAGVRRRDLHFS
jgi:ABC-2 type transport system permease protein